jgi:hypothetical protein
VLLIAVLVPWRVLHQGKEHEEPAQGVAVPDGFDRDDRLRKRLEPLDDGGDGVVWPRKCLGKLRAQSAQTLSDGALRVGDAGPICARNRIRASKPASFSKSASMICHSSSVGSFGIAFLALDDGATRCAGPFHQAGPAERGGISPASLLLPPTFYYSTLPPASP